MRLNPPMCKTPKTPQLQEIRAISALRDLSIDVLRYRAVFGDREGPLGVPIHVGWVRWLYCTRRECFHGATVAASHACSTTLQLRKQRARDVNYTAARSRDIYWCTEASKRTCIRTKSRVSWYARVMHVNSPFWEPDPNIVVLYGNLVHGIGRARQHVFQFMDPG